MYIITSYRSENDHDFDIVIVNMGKTQNFDSRDEDDSCQRRDITVHWN